MANHNYNRKRFITIVGILLVAIIVVIFGLFTYTDKKSADFYKPEDATIYNSADFELAKANGLVPLHSNQTAILGLDHGLGKPQDLEVVANGNNRKMQTDSLSHYIITPKAGQRVLVPESTFIFSKFNSNEFKEKISTEVREELADKDSVKVIITMSTDGVYEESQSKSEYKQKSEEFESAKEEVEDLMQEKKLFKDVSNGAVQNELPLIGSVSAVINERALDDLAGSSLVKRVELDQPVSAFLDTSLDQINAYDTQSTLDSGNNELTGRGVTIAIIDTGVNYNLADLGGCFGDGCKVAGGYDFINADNDPMDDQGHGSHVAATAAGKGRLNGVAPDARILAYKVLDANGFGSMSDIIKAIQLSVDPNQDGDTSDHANVASMSLGGDGGPDSSVSLAVDEATKLGVVFTVAAGNSGPVDSTIGAPGAARSAITVAAACKPSEIGTNTLCEQAVASFSSRGPVFVNGTDLQKPDVAAPGVNICAARSNDIRFGGNVCFDNDHIRLNGTSMATPQVAGVAALLLQDSPNLSPQEVKAKIKSTAKDLGLEYKIQGSGLINLAGAVSTKNQIVSTPNHWEVNEKQTGRIIEVSKQFLLSAPDLSSSQIVPISDLSKNGISISFEKTILNSIRGVFEPLNAKITIDHNLVSPGSYDNSISLMSGGIKKGLIPIHILVNDALEITTYNDLDFGIFDPSASSWTSTDKYLTIKNNRTDSPNAVKLELNGISGISLNNTGEIVIPANGSESIKINLHNTTPISNGIYSGKVNIFHDSKIIGRISLKFTKYFPINLNIEKSETAEPVTLWAFNRQSGDSMGWYTKPGRQTIFLSDASKYDFMLSYSDRDPLTLESWSSFVFKENVAVAGEVALNFSPNEATEQFKITPTDENGQFPKAKFSTSTVFANTINTKISLTMVTSGGTGYYSKVMYSKAADYKIEQQLISLQPAEKVYCFMGQSPMYETKIVTNQVGDLKRVEIINKSDKVGQLSSPEIILAREGTGDYYFQNQFIVKLPGDPEVINLPSNQILFLSNQESAFYFQQYINKTAVLYDKFYIDRNVWTNVVDNKALIPYRFPPYGIPDQVYSGLTNKLSNQLDPPVWFGKFNITDKSIANIVPPWKNGQGKDYVFLNQDFSFMNYEPVDYVIKRSGILIASGQLPGFDDGWQEAVSKPLLNYQNGAPGPTEFLIESFSYRAVGNKLGKSSVRVVFDVSKQDPNPPYFKRLNFYTNGSLNNRYEEKQNNRIIYETDPSGGKIVTSKVAYSVDNINFNELSSTQSDGAFVVDLPSIKTTNMLTISIETTDDSGNSLKYNFQVPAFSLDSNPPVGTLSGKKFTNSNLLTVNVSADDPEKNQISMRFSNNGNSWSDWEAYNTRKDWSITDPVTGGDNMDGVKTVYAQFMDSFDNLSSASLNTTYDLTAPIVKIDGSKRGYPKQKIKLSPLVEDNISSVMNVKWEKISGDGGIKFDSDSTKDTYVMADNNGSYKIKIIATDEAGNLSESVMELLINKAGDINGDGKINNDDFTLLLFNWGVPRNLMGDINGDGKTNNDDFTILLFWWNQ